jgi:hypothetical protein
MARAYTASRQGGASGLLSVPQAPGARIRALGYLVLTRAGSRPCRNAGCIPEWGCRLGGFLWLRSFCLVPQAPGAGIRALGLAPLPERIMRSGWWCRFVDK